MSQLVVTERNGVLAIFSNGPTGLRQRLIMDAEGAELNHHDLAEFALRLADEFAWSAVPSHHGAKRPAVKAPPAKAVAPAKRRIAKPTRRSLPRGTPANALRPAWTAEVMAQVNAAPGSTHYEIADAIDMHDRTVFALLRNLLAHGAVRYEQRNMTAPRRYYAIETSAMADTA